MTEDFGFKEMQKLQMQLQEKYKDKWEAIAPEAGKINFCGRVKKSLSNKT